MKILILASNPRKDLNLDHEIRDLKDVIEKSNNRQQLEVEDALAVRVGELQDLLFKHTPQIVHFCGHGGGQTGLVFEDNNGREQWVQTEALRDLFRLFSDEVGCVILNACYSEEQANEIVDHIDYVIGMSQTIRDDAAIAFSKGFYRALSYDCSIAEAYEFGCNAIQLEITGSSNGRTTAIDLTRKAEVVNAVATTIIPEHLKPTLKTKPGILNAERWKNDAKIALSEEEKEVIQLELAQEVTSISPSKLRLDKAQTGDRLLIAQTRNAPSSHRYRLFQWLTGGFVACLFAIGGIYGYRYSQEEQARNIRQDLTKSDQQARMQAAIELGKRGQFEAAIELLKQFSADPSIATQYSGYLEAWSTQLLSQAEKFYNQGEVDVAIGQAQKIPESSSVYKDAQAKIEDWSKDKQIFNDIIKGLEVHDVQGGRRKLQQINSQGLSKKAETAIAAIEQKIADSPTVKPPLPPNPVADNPYTWLSEREVTQADLAGKSAKELKIMRNSIYARYGLSFDDPELQSIFSKFKGYKPTYKGKQGAEAIYKMFSDLEKGNVERLRNAEKQLTP